MLRAAAGEVPKETHGVADESAPRSESLLWGATIAALGFGDCGLPEDRWRIGEELAGGTGETAEMGGTRRMLKHKPGASPKTERRRPGGRVGSAGC